jgi:spermidine synthase
MNAEQSVPLRMGVFPWMAPVIQPRKSGPVVVDTFEITPDTWQGFGCERTKPGTYARLRINGAVVMSDTDMELRTNVRAVKRATGDVLIGGFGLGLVPFAMLRKSDVRHIHIVEKNPDVIKASANPLIAQLAEQDRERITVERGDVFTWEPRVSRRQFDFIYFDIWTELCVDDVEPRSALHKRYSRWLRKGGEVTSWEYDHLRSLKRAGRWR